MIRVLIFISTAFSCTGGLTTAVLNYFKFFEKNDLIQFDFASTNKCPDNLKNFLNERGYNYYDVGNKKKNPLKYIAKLNKIYRENNYDIVHVHGNSATMSLELGLAKLCEVPVRIAHCHNAQTNYPMLNKIAYPLFLHTYTHALAVSETAGKWLFNNDFIVLNNAIDVEKYKFNKNNRDNLRKQYNIRDEIVLGVVGKFNEQKNHRFVIMLFEKLVKEHRNMKLILIGDGPLFNVVKNEIEEKKLTSSIIMTGMIDDVSPYYSMMDIFLFPSKFEGLGLSAIEAQANGLICLCSKQVPIETNLTKMISYHDLKNIDEWIKKINYLKNYDREKVSQEACREITSKGYNAGNEAKYLLELYLQFKKETN